MQETLVSFKVAELAKKKGFNVESLKFYTKPRSKMYGLDEEGRPYPIKNIPKKIYTVGEDATLNTENVIFAPTQDLLQKWLREVHNISICIYPVLYEWEVSLHTCHKRKKLPIYLNPNNSIHGKTYEEAREEALFQALNLLPDVKI